jgi:hypothetical protein
VRRGHAIALVGALALLLVTAMDWYGTATGEQAREAQRLTEDTPQLSEESEDAQVLAEREEKNAWQADRLIDRILLVLMVGAAALAALTAITRAAGAKPTEGLGPAGLAALLATAAAAVVAYRIIQEPGLDAATTVKAGAPLAFLPLALIALGSASALREDDREAEAPTEDEEESG